MKKWYTSKVVWFNALTVLVTVATYFGFTPNQELAANTTVYILMIAPLVNLVLRFVTKKSIVGLE